MLLGLDILLTVIIFLNGGASEEKSHTSSYGRMYCPYDFPLLLATYLSNSTSFSSDSQHYCLLQQ